MIILKLLNTLWLSGFSTGVENMGWAGEGGGSLQNLMGGGGLKSIHGGSMGRDLKCCRKIPVMQFI